MRFAWYGAQSASRITAAENKFGLTADGKTLDFRAVVQPTATANIGGTPDWLFSSTYLGPLIDGAQAGKRKIWWSVAPFGTGDGNWGSAATGSYDSQFSTLFTKMVQVEARNGNASGPIECRYAFEFNGNWFAWKARGNEANMITTWRRMWNIANGIAPGRFQWEWAPSETTQLQGEYADPNACWPGDQYVQKVGLDIYWKPFESWQWGTNPDNAFTSATNSPLGLNWLKNFAASHGNKPMVFSEWGVQPATATSSGESVTTEPYIRKFADWCLANGVEGTLYWNGYSGEGFVGDVITHSNWPNQYNAIKTNFVDKMDNTNPFGTSTGGGSTGGGSTGGVTKALVNDPYTACTQINSLTYNKTTLTATEIAQINDISYGPLVASGRKTDSTYGVTPLSLGDTTAVQASLDDANDQIDALTSSLATATSNVSSLQAQVSNLNTQLTAQKAATKTATDNYTAAQAQVTSLTSQLATVTAERDAALANGGASASDLAAAQAQVASLTTQLQTAQTNLTAAQTAKTAAETAKATAEANLAAKQTELDAAQDDLAEAQARIEALEAAGGGTSGDAVTLLSKIVQAAGILTSAIPAEQQRQQQVDAQIETLKQRLADAQAAAIAADTANGTNT